MTSFADLGLCEPLLRAVADAGYETPTPIQAEGIPHLMEGRDLFGCAQTGTGKTAAFALPILHQLAANPQAREARTARALILCPTRELASQIGQNLTAYAKYLDLTHVLIHGGVRQDPQERALRRGVDIIVATPGRLLDLMNQGHLRLWSTKILVLDEADRMLDMGFIHDIKEILAAVPRQRQAMMFSATLPDSIKGLAANILTDPVEVMVDPPASTVERVDQRVMFVERADKRSLLTDMIHALHIERALVFMRTKHGASRLAGQLSRHSGLPTEAIHGDRTQSAREQALASFRKGETRVLVATDVAARGLDIDGVTHVINFDLPHEAESYVHRIGRTARAGADGVAISFCDVDEQAYLRDIERLTSVEVRIIEDHPYHCQPAMDKFLRNRAPRAAAPSSGKGGGRSRSRRGPRRAPASGQATASGD